MDNKGNEILNLSTEQSVNNQVSRVRNVEQKSDNVKYIGNKIFENKTMIMKRKTVFGLGRKILGYLGISYIGCLLVFPLTMRLETAWAKLLMQLVCLVTTYTSIYIPMWYEGRKDFELVDQKKIKFDPNRPLFAGVICVVPYFVSYLFLFFGKILNIEILYSIYRILNVQFLGLLLTLNPSAYVTDVENWHLILFFALPFTFIFCSIFAYNMGYTGKKILGKDVSSTKVDVENL